MLTSWNHPKGQIVQPISYEEAAMHTTLAQASHQPFRAAPQHCSRAVAQAVPYRVTPRRSHILALWVLAIGVWLGPVANAFAHGQTCPPNRTGQQHVHTYDLLEVHPNPATGLLETHPNPATGLAQLSVATDANHPDGENIIEMNTSGLLPRNEPRWHICAWQGIRTPIDDPTLASVTAYTVEYGHMHPADGSTQDFSNSRLFYYHLRTERPWNNRVITGIIGLTDHQNQFFRWYWVIF